MKKITLIILAILISACTTTGQQASTAAANLRHLPANSFSVTSLATPAIYNAMKPEDQKKLEVTIGTAKPQGVTTWENKDSGDMFEMTSLSIYVDDHGRACRKYKMRALVNGRESDMLETMACRLDDGTWKGINQGA